MDEPAGSVEEAEDAGAYRFLCGADMDPSAVRAADPAARFVARARLATAGGAANEVWGILLRLPAGGTGADEEREVVTDDGRRFRAVAVGGGEPAGEAAAVLAAARYWELPPAYVRRVRERPGAETGG